MEIKKNKKSKGTIFWRGIILLIIIIIYFQSTGPKEEGRIPDDFKYWLCDAETVINGLFVNGNEEYKNGNCQSEDESHSGKYSCKCTPSFQYGMTKEFGPLNPNDLVIISIWMKGASKKGRLIFSADDNSIFRFTDEVKKTSNGWQFLSDTIRIPKDIHIKKALAFPYSTDDNNPVYFDDLKIIVQESAADIQQELYEAPNFKIKVTDANYNHLLNKRNEAFEKGLLFASKNDLVPAKFKINKSDFKGKIRLKGDLLDHLLGEKWSFRIKLNNKSKWNGLSTFSVHNSEARSHLSEWVMHQLFLKEGIITPKYDFLSISLNEKDLGVYAYEQHFDNSILNFNKRIIGPILRHNDDGYWDNVNKKIEPFEWANSSQIEIFNKENNNQQGFKELFNQGQSLLRDFLHGRKAVSQVFEIDKIAKYYALLELSHALHAQALTNIRFYFDPIGGRIEPIGFDCFGDHLPKVTKNWTSIGEGLNSKLAEKPFFDTGDIYMLKLFLDYDFFAKYLYYINKYSSPDFLKGFKNSLSSKIATRQEFIRSDTLYSNYTFSWESLFNKAKFTRNKIYPHKNLSLKAFTINNSRQKIQLKSFHPFPLEVIGFGNDSLTENRRMILEPFNPKIPVESYNFNLINSAKKVFYKTLGLDSIFVMDIPKINAPANNTPIVSPNISDLASFDFININKNTIEIMHGSHIIDRPLIIPEGYFVSFPKGLKLTLVSNGSILSYSPISAIGSSNNPIIIEGIGEGNNGIIISSVKDRFFSLFENCNFVNLSQVKYRNVSTNGAITSYKSNVKFNKCNFIGMSGQYALSLVYASYNLESCFIFNARGTGIDSQYSVGEIDSIKINKIGKNGIDQIGGLVNCHSFEGHNIRKNGVNVLENGKLTVQGFSLSDSSFGISANSGADIKMYNVTFNNLKRGVKILSDQQPPTSVFLNDFAQSDVIKEYQIQKNAILKFNSVQQTPQ